MSKIILVLGGARSGKSAHAADLAKRINKSIVFIATAAALDEEMKQRIRLHKSSRPKSWGLIEETIELTDVLRTLKSRYAVALIDCMGLWITNLLMTGIKDKVIEKKIAEFADAICKAKAASIIVVSNEVGSGIVPGDSLSREFRDLLGLANQVLAKKADKVVFMQAGIPLIIKERNTYGKIG
mgnify:FL=1